jgi:hypothetical protein
MSEAKKPHEVADIGWAVEVRGCDIPDGRYCVVGVNAVSLAVWLGDSRGSPLWVANKCIVAAYRPGAEAVPEAPDLFDMLGRCRETLRRHGGRSNYELVGAIEEWMRAADDARRHIVAAREVL